MKYTSKIRKSIPTDSQQAISDNRNGISAAPPEYRIDFADNAPGFANTGYPGSAPAIQTKRNIGEEYVTCSRPVPGNQPPIQRQELEEDKEVQMMAAAPHMKRVDAEAEPAVKAADGNWKRVKRVAFIKLQDGSFINLANRLDDEMKALNRRRVVATGKLVIPADPSAQPIMSRPGPVPTLIEIDSVRPQSDEVGA